MMNSEQIQILYKRAEQVFIAKTGKKPHKITLTEEGTIYCYYLEYYCGETDEIGEDITPEDLTSDLDAIIEKRKQKEREEKEAYEKHRRELKQMQEHRAIEERRKKYEELKREFEP